MNATRKTKQSTLARRRLSMRVRRLGAALCAALAVFAALQSLSALVRTETVVVASADIARGETLSAAKVSVMEIPVSGLGSGAYRDAGEVGGSIAQIPIARGQPLFRGMIAKAPVAPDGSTTIEVRLASVPDRLIAGDAVDLVSSVGCGDQSAQSCTLATNALTISAPIGSAGSAPKGGLGGMTDMAAEPLTVTFALKPQEALAVLAQQEAGPLLAVLHAPDGEQSDGEH
ncbi:SAF domain-containing protein [Bifidobacterium vespertilionis]|uniref:SAF domain-containing protein n=1 Tax=Bifidobacterium vespertilionis TaxID=2562524 RepID=UPI001BDD6611|nr:SAF domain-containing protein [Bifidobacterium vespertilionis]MBT1179834.1 flagella basal body P-ring formation protein FlgA [Bifidobacterium vespertilionis]